MRRRLYTIAGGLALLSLSACAEAPYREANYATTIDKAPPAPPPPPSGAARSFEALAAAAPGAMAEEVVISERDSSAPREMSLGFKAEGKPDESSTGSAGAAPPSQPQAPPPPPPPPPKPMPALTPGDPSARATSGEVAAIRAPLLVYTAQITVAVFEVAASLAQIEALGREMGGFLARRDDQSITIRVPASRFDETVKRIEKVGDVVHRNVTAEDVTEEFRDLEVRLKSAHAVQDRLTQLLAKAVKVEESVMIERELDRVSGEIDRIEGRMKFLRDRATFSTVTVSFEPKSKEVVGQGPFRLPGRWLNELGLGRLLSL